MKLMRVFLAVIIVMLSVTGADARVYRGGAQHSDKPALMGINLGNNVTYPGGFVASCQSNVAGDLVVDASDNRKVKSATYKFVKGDVGHPLLSIPNGSTMPAGWSQGLFQITSVDPDGSAHLATSPAAVGTTGGYFHYGIAADCQYWHKEKLNLVRIAFQWEALQTSLGGSLNLVYLSSLEDIVRQLGYLGMRGFLDCHNFGGYGGIAIGNPGGPTEAQFVNLWTRLSPLVAGQLGYYGSDIMNEPVGMTSPSVWFHAAQAAITGIRGAGDTTSALIVEGYGYASSYQWLDNGNDALNGLHDPNHNIVISAHAYGDTDNSGTYGTYALYLQNPIAYPQFAACPHDINNNPTGTSYDCAVVLGDGLDHGATLDENIFVKRYLVSINWYESQTNADFKGFLLGESGIPFDDNRWNIALGNGLDLLQNHHAMFTYWAGAAWAQCAASSEPGQTTACSYFLGVYPTNLTSSTTSLNSMGNVTGLPTKQMALLEKYTGVSADTYQIYGAGRGSSGVPSNPMAVIYNSYIRRAFTVTPNDASAGGTFAPSSITCAIGYGCNGAFTYTPSGTNIYLVGATSSNNGLIDPPAFGYATIADQFSAAGILDSQIGFDFSTIKNHATYAGACATLQRKYDGNIRTFSFATPLGSACDPAGIFAWSGFTETDTITANLALTVNNALLFGSDVSVTYANSTPLTRVWKFEPPGVYAITAPVLLTGQYYVSALGRYNFAAGDIGQAVTIKYIMPDALVTWYGQEGRGQTAGVITPESGGPVNQASNMPTWMLNCQNGLPCIYWNGTNYMDMSFPVGGTSQNVLTTASVFAPGTMNLLPYGPQGFGAVAPPAAGSDTGISVFYNGPLWEFGWANDERVIPWASSVINGGGWGSSYYPLYSNSTSFTGGYSGSTTLQIFSQDGAFHATGSTFRANTSLGATSFFDGRIVDRSDTLETVFTGSISGNTLTVTANGTYLGTYQQITGMGVAPGTIILRTLSAWDGTTGTYLVNNSQTISSEQMNTLTYFSNAVSQYCATPSGASCNFDNNTPVANYHNIFRNNAHLGYSRAIFTTPSTYRGFMMEATGINAALAPSNYQTMQNVQLSHFGIPSQAGPTTYAPTLNFNTSGLNALPWMGFNDLVFSGEPSNAPAYYADHLGMNIVRAQVYYANYMDSPDSTSLDTAYVASLQPNIDAFTAKGISVLLDNHSPLCWANNRCIGNGGITNTQFANFWGLMGAQYKNNPNIQFDIANEPSGYSASTLATLYQQVINAIRASGSTNVIQLEWGPSFSACSSMIGDGDTTAFAGLTDSAGPGKLVLHCHNYFDEHNGGYQTNGAIAAKGAAVGDLTALTAWAVAGNHHLFWGEFGYGWTASSTEEFKVAFDLIKANLATDSTGGWNGWSAWGGGTFGWGKGYFFRFGPNPLTAPIPDDPKGLYLNAFATGHTALCADGTTGPCGTTRWPYDTAFPPKFQ